MDGIGLTKKYPIPEDHKGMDGNGYAVKYPFRQMEIGHSFLFPKNLSSNSVYCAVRRANVTYDARFTVRSTPEGFRCWRIE